MKAEDRLRLFTVANSLAENELDKIETRFGIDLCRETASNGMDEEYYPQFDIRMRNEAHMMSEHYEVFYCLERSIRELIIDKMKSSYGEDWWNSKVTEEICKNVEKNMKLERDAGFTQRSDLLIDYTTFGELSGIVQKNWEAFDDIFTSQRAFGKIMANLNLLRALIAHCCPLAEDEIVRLRLTVRDWFRLME